ncbi:MAG: hypothetical protein ACK551_08805 [Vampirovibrionales bacterium]
MMTSISPYSSPSATNQQRTGVLSVNSYVQTTVPQTPLFNRITATIESVVPGKALDILENAMNSATHQLDFSSYEDEGILVRIQEITRFPSEVVIYNSRFWGSLDEFATLLLGKDFQERERFPFLFGNSPKPTPAPDAKTA